MLVRSLPVRLLCENLVVDVVGWGWILIVEWALVVIGVFLKHISIVIVQMVVLEGEQSSESIKHWSLSLFLGLDLHIYVRRHYINRNVLIVLFLRVVSLLLIVLMSHG